MSGPDVYGPAEARAILNVGEARFRVLARRDGFPQATQLEIGRVWDGAEIRAFALQRTGARFAGRPVLAAVLAKRQGMSVREIARQAKVSDTTAAAWLRAASA